MNAVVTHLMERYYQLVGSGVLAKWLLPKPKVPANPPPSDGSDSQRLQLEIVSHCWKYTHLLAYQLSSVVLYPPENLELRFTVFHSSEDKRTTELLHFIEQHHVPSVEWNWWSLERRRLARRAIGRNLAARNTTAHWIWFTDCDQVFHQGCLDALASLLPNQQGTLLFPRQVSCTNLLPGDDPMFSRTGGKPKLVDIDPREFHPVTHKKAIGALQIVRGDAARSIGYCDHIPFFQQPSDSWRNTYEDRVFRSLIGSNGEPIELPNLFRIEHLAKGRKHRGRRAA